MYTGFVKTLIHGLWTVLECGPDNRPLLRPSPPPMTHPNDRVSAKVRLSTIIHWIYYQGGSEISGVDTQMPI